PNGMDAVITEASRAWRDLVEQVARSSAEVRLRRNAAMLERDEPTTTRMEQPTLLLDRRLTRERWLTAADRSSRRVHLAARLADARVAATVTFRPPELLFVAEP
ncbi:MAG TPA: hypothetical protein VFF43_05090, partial [Caldimonas sp.]|nr:hypothetical protein [Caldimonas sp.]